MSGDKNERMKCNKIFHKAATERSVASYSDSDISRFGFLRISKQKKLEKQNLCAHLEKPFKNWFCVHLCCYFWFKLCLVEKFNVKNFFPKDSDVLSQRKRGRTVNATQWKQGVGNLRNVGESFSFVNSKSVSWSGGGRGGVEVPMY